MKKKKKKTTNSDMDAFDMVNEFGTYNIQPTADTDNEFPKIRQK